MTTLYQVLEVSALLMVIIIPLAGPNKKKSKTIAPIEISEWAIDENGSLQHTSDAKADHHPVK